MSRLHRLEEANAYGTRKAGDLNDALYRVVCAEGRAGTLQEALQKQEERVRAWEELAAGRAGAADKAAELAACTAGAADNATDVCVSQSLLMCPK